MSGRTSQPMWNQLIQLPFRSKISLQAQIREMLMASILDGHLPLGVACRRRSATSSSPLVAQCTKF